MKRGVITFDLETIQYLEQSIKNQLVHSPNTATPTSLPSELVSKLALRTDDARQSFEFSETTVEALLDLLPPPHLESHPAESKLRQVLQAFIQA